MKPWVADVAASIRYNIIMSVSNGEGNGFEGYLCKCLHGLREIHTFKKDAKVTLYSLKSL